MNFRQFCLATFTSAIAFNSLAGPKRKKRRIGERGHQPISIQSVRYEGKGCQQGATASLVTATDPESPEIKDFFQLIYDAFYVEATSDMNGNVVRANCIVHLELDIPDDMKLRMTKLSTEMSGYAALIPKTKGIVQIYNSFRRGRKEAQVKRVVIDSEQYDGDFQINRTSVIHSTANECGNTTLKLRTALAIRVKPNKPLTGYENAFIQVDESTGLMKQKWRVKLFPCDHPGGGRRGGRGRGRR